MKNKGILFLLLIIIVCAINVSAVSAEGDIASDINTNDNQELILEENLNNDVLTDYDSAELASSTNDEEKLTASSSANVKLKEKTKKASSKRIIAFKTISRGSKDKATVKKIQKALKRNGYYLSYKGHYLKVDGWFAYYTERAVKQFQRAEQLKVTGKVDAKTAEKLEILYKPNAIIKFENDKPLKREYKDGKSFEVKIVNKSHGKGIATVLSIDYLKNGKRLPIWEYISTDGEGINYITPDCLEVGTYIAKIYCQEPNIKAIPKFKKVIITKTSIRIKAKDIRVSDNQNIQLKAKLKFKKNEKVNVGKVKFTIDGKSYIVKVNNGVAILNLKLKEIKSKTYQVTFLGTENIKVKTVTGKIIK